jgi:hypothetical protein
MPVTQQEKKTMKTIAIIVAAAALAASPALAQNTNANPNAPGQDRDCLITWMSEAEATSAANATAVSGKYLPRKAAEAQAAKSGGKARVFDYSDDTWPTTAGGSVTITSNAEEQEFCEGPEFNR